MQVTLKEGTRPHFDALSYVEAVQRGHDELARPVLKHVVELGGPKKATLAQALVLYAKTISINKGGVNAELNRINPRQFEERPSSFIRRRHL